MTIKNLYDHFKDAAIIHEADPEYNNDEWWLAFRGRLRHWLVTWHGRKELLDYLAEEWTNYAGETYQRGTYEAYQHNIDVVIDTILAANAYKYRHLYALYVAEYNPIWNVDGTEKIVITEEGTEEGTGSRQASGADTVQNATTTYDEDTAHPTDSGTQNYGRKDEDSREGSHTLERTETRTRGGNIGVTMTQDMEQKEKEWAGMLDLIRVIVGDLANAIAYPFC